MWCKVQVLLLVAYASAQVVPGSASGDFPPDKNPHYFPIGVFAEGTSDGNFEARWYAEQLRALNEPSLLENPSGGGESVYRFTWLRSFHHPITVRITVHINGTGTLTAKMTDGQGGYKPRKLIVNTTRDISVTEVRHLITLIETMGFWQMSPKPARSSLVGLDGAQWILEASRHNDYHVVDRWSPEKGPLRELGLYLARTLGKLSVPAKTIY